MNKYLLLCLLSFIFSARTISQYGLNLIKELEGLRLTSYIDYDGVLKIGYATTNDDYFVTNTKIKPGMNITKETAEKWLIDSLDRIYEPRVNKYDALYKWTQNEFDALISFAHNMGNIDKLTNNGKISKNYIANNMVGYIYSKGRQINELVKRRYIEYNLFKQK